jgi:hypothetical protein
MEEFSKHIDKKFTDRAWSEMQKLLDQEMPVVRASRRRGWLFWLVLLGLGAGLTASAVLYFSRQKRGNISPPRVPVAQVSPAIPEEPAPENAPSTDLVVNTISSSGEKNGSRENSYKLNNGKIGATTNRHEPARSTLNASGLQNLPLTPVPRQPVEEKNTAAANPANPTLEKAPQPEELISDVPALTETTVDAAGQPPALRSFSDVPTLGQATLNTLEVSANPAPLAHVALPPLARANPSLLLYGSGFGISPSGGDGLAAGFLGKLELKNKSFFIEAGLGYTYYRQPLYVLATYPDPLDSGPLAGLSGDTTIAYTFKSGVNGLMNIPISSESSTNYLRASFDLGMHYLELPVSFGWRASPRWSLQSGLNFSLLIVSAPGFTEGGLFAQNAKELDLLQGNSTESSLAVELTKFDLAANAGVFFHLLPQVSIGFQYQLGLIDVLPANKESDYNRFFRLSLRYRL